MYKPEHFQQKMPLDECRYWLECLEANLLDADYHVATDCETHHKLAALQRLATRNIELEQALIGAFEAIEKAQRILGKRL